MRIVSRQFNNLQLLTQRISIFSQVTKGHQQMFESNLTNARRMFELGNEGAGIRQIRREFRQIATLWWVLWEQKGLTSYPKVIRRRGWGLKDWRREGGGGGGSRHVKRRHVATALGGGGLICLICLNAPILKVVITLRLLIGDIEQKYP